MILKKLLIMQNHLLKKNNFFILFLFFFLQLNSNLLAIENIFITGNKNISSKTIYSLAPKNIQKFEKETINDYQKKLFESGFFSNVTLEIKNKKLFIKIYTTKSQWHKYCSYLSYRSY